MAITTHGTIPGMATVMADGTVVGTADTILITLTILIILLVMHLAMAIQMLTMAQSIACQVIELTVHHHSHQIVRSQQQMVPQDVKPELR